MADLGVERTLWTPGASRLELTLTEDHLNKGGVAHGGIHMMLLDSALGSALVASLKVEEWCATAQLSTSFLAAARPGERMVAEGRACDVERTWLIWQAKNERLVAHGLAIWRGQGGRAAGGSSDSSALMSVAFVGDLVEPTAFALRRVSVARDNGDKGIGE